MNDETSTEPSSSPDSGARHHMVIEELARKHFELSTPTVAWMSLSHEARDRYVKATDLIFGDLLHIQSTTARVVEVEGKHRHMVNAVLDTAAQLEALVTKLRIAADPTKGWGEWIEGHVSEQLDEAVTFDDAGDGEADTIDVEVDEGPYPKGRPIFWSVGNLLLQRDESGDMIGFCHDTPENRERLVHKNFLMVEKDPYSS